MVSKNSIINKKITALQEMIDIDIKVAEELKKMRIDNQPIKIVLENLCNYQDILNQVQKY